MNLVPALRVASALIFLAGCVGALVRGTVLAGPFVVAAVLLALSFLAIRRPREIAFVSIGISLVIPIGVTLGWLRGDLEGATVVLDGLVFGWLLITAVRSLRAASAPVDGAAP